MIRKILKFIYLSFAWLLLGMLWIQVILTLGEALEEKTGGGQRFYTCLLYLYCAVGGTIIGLAGVINYLKRRRVINCPKYALLTVLLFTLLRTVLADPIERLGIYLWHCPLPQSIVIIRIPLLFFVTGGTSHDGHEAERIGREIGVAFVPMVVFLAWSLVVYLSDKRTKAKPTADLNH